MNHSNRTLRGNLMRCRMADLAAAQMTLDVACLRCLDRRELRAAAVVAERGCGPMMIEEFLRRLRCSVPRCGSPPSRWPIGGLSTKHSSAWSGQSARRPS